jgi:hypothetical protein
MKLEEKGIEKMMPLLWSWTSNTYSIADKRVIAGMNI